jgi:hypothetical protein
VGGMWSVGGMCKVWVVWGDWVVWGECGWYGGSVGGMGRVWGMWGIVSEPWSVLLCGLFILRARNTQKLMVVKVSV